MRKLRPWTAFVLVLAGGALVLRALPSRADDKADKPSEAVPATGPTTAPAAATSPDLAARYASLAQDTLRLKEVTPSHYKESAALLMAAMKLDPDEPRYPRMLYEAMLQLHDNQGALNALKAYRSIAVVGRVEDQPVNDQLMMINYIDLTAGMMETAEQKLDYYKAILDSRAPDPVKSHSAFRASQIARERGQSDLEDNLIGQSLKFNPLNMNTLRTRLEQLSVEGTATERVGVMQTMLKSNPAQPRILYRLAREVADAGLPEESLRHYTIAANLAGALGISMGREFALGYASELFMMNQAQLLVPAKEILKELLKQDPGDVESLLLLWLSQKAGGAAEKEDADKTAKQLLNAQLNRVLTIRQDVAGAANPTTRPVDSPDALVIPDLAGDVEKIKDEKFDNIRNSYAQAVTDLTWYLTFAGGQPAQAEKLLPTLKALLSEKAVVVRIEGWIYKTQDKLEPAGVKLKAVADQDVLAQAGTLVLWARNPAEKASAIAAAKKLLMEHNSGLLGALLIDAFRELNIKVAARDDGEAIKALIAQFPKEWYKILEQPNSMYILKAEMAGGKISFRFGEPMIARVYLKNKSPFDITIGPEGVIKNDLWFDIELRGLVQQKIPGAAYDRLGQSLVLKPGDMISQTVRLDQGQLGQVLVSLPNPSLTFYAHVRTNPSGASSAPGGYDTSFSSITERAGFSPSDASLRALTGQIATGSPTERLRALELMGAEVEQLRNQKELDDKGKLLVTAFMEIFQKTTDDPNQPVATWGMFLTAVHNPAKRVEMMGRLRADADPFRRLLSLLIVASLKFEEWDPLESTCRHASLSIL